MQVMSAVWRHAEAFTSLPGIQDKRDSDNSGFPAPHAHVSVTFTQRDTRDGRLGTSPGGGMGKDRGRSPRATGCSRLPHAPQPAGPAGPKRSSGLRGQPAGQPNPETGAETGHKGVAAEVSQLSRPGRKLCCRRVPLSPPLSIPELVVAPVSGYCTCTRRPGQTPHFGLSAVEAPQKMKNRVTV